MRSLSATRADRLARRTRRRRWLISTAIAILAIIVTALIYVWNRDDVSGRDRVANRRALLEAATKDLTNASTLLRSEIAVVQNAGEPPRSAGPSARLDSVIRSLDSTCNALSAGDAVRGPCRDAVRSLDELNRGVGVRDPAAAVRDVTVISAATTAFNRALHP